MKRYQIIKRPIATASGERGVWSFAAHGARWEREEALRHCALLKENGYQARMIAV